MSLAEPATIGWRAVLAEMAEGARDAAFRFPVTTVLLFLLTVELNLDIAGVGGLLAASEDETFHALFVAACGSVAATLACEARRTTALVGQVAAAILAAVSFAVAYWNRVFDAYDPAFAAALAGLVLVAPFVGRGNAKAFWLFGLRVAFAALLAGLALLLFAGGISAILASLTYLFGLEIPERAYQHVWAVTGLFAAPMFGLGQMPHDFSDEPDANTAAFMDRGMRALGDFVAAPLLLVYAAILHAYALKIVVTQDVPQGQIGWLVLGFGVCIVGSLLLCHPFFVVARAPTRLFLRLWPLLLPVPLLLLFYATAMRIGEYGVTPDRYLLVLFGLVLAAILLLQFPKGTRGDIRWLAALPVLALLVASFGPQGALATSIRSQAERFQVLVAEQPLTGERHNEALSALRFLQWNGALHTVAPEGTALTPPGSADAEDRLFEEIAAAYGIDPDLRLGPDGMFNRSYEQAAFAASGFDVVVPVIGIYESGSYPVTMPSGRVLDVQIREGAVSIGDAAGMVRFVVPVEELRRRAASPDQPSSKPEQGRAMVLKAEGRRIMLVPTHLSGSFGTEPVLRSFSGSLLLRTQDWR